MQIEILINNNSCQTRSLFFGRYLGSSRKVVKPRNDREEDHTQVWHRIYRVVGSFFSMCMYFVECLFMKNKPLAEKVWSLFLYIFPTFGVQAITTTTATTIAPNKSFTCTLVFLFLHIYSLFYAKQQEK